MATISVGHAGDEVYRVTIEDGSGRTQHEVTVDQAALDRFGGSDPARLIEESFRFLLEREPKESILPRFDLPAIARYFPEYPEEIRRRLA